MADRVWRQAVNLGPYPCPDVTTAVKCQFWHFAKTLSGALLSGPTTPGAWSVLGSSGYVDAVFGGALDGVDRLGATYDPANMVLAVSGQNHNWIAFQAPAAFGDNTGTYYAVLDLVSTTASTMTIGKTAPTGGSATAAPTISDPNKWVVTLTNINGSYGNYRPSVLLSENGDAITVSQFVANKFNFCWMVVTLLEHHAIDQYPVAVYARASTSNAIVYTDFSYSSGYFRMKSHTGNADVSAYALYPGSSNGTTVFSDMAPGDVISGQIPEVPMYLLVTTAGHQSVRGRVPDLYSVPTLSLGYVRPSVGPQEAQSLGGVMFPFTTPVAVS